MRKQAYKETAAMSALAEMLPGKASSIEFSSGSVRYLLKFGRKRDGKLFVDLVDKDDPKRFIKLESFHPEEIVHALAEVPKSLAMVSQVRDMMMKRARLKKASRDVVASRSIRSSLEAIDDRKKSLLRTVRAHKRILSAGEPGRLRKSASMKISNLRSEEGSVRALVGAAGKRAYRVRVAMDGGCSCECEDFQRTGSPCKHILALSSVDLNKNAIPRLARIDRFLKKVLENI